MIAKVVRGNRVRGLVYYLFGPGRANEHVDPRVVAGYAGAETLDPRALAGDVHEGVGELGRLLHEPLVAVRGGSDKEEVLRRWEKIDNPGAYARRAVVSCFLKDKTRGLDRVRHRQVERGHAVPAAADDSRLTVWEDRQWVTQMLESLPPAQRAAMAFIVDDFAPAEVAELLGKTPPAIRQNLCEARRRLKAALHQERTAEQPGRSPSSPGKEAR